MNEITTHSCSLFGLDQILQQALGITSVPRVESGCLFGPVLPLARYPAWSFVSRFKNSDSLLDENYNGKRTYVTTTSRITSGDELKRRNGLGGSALDFWFINGRHHTPNPFSDKSPMTINQTVDVISKSTGFDLGAFSGS